MRGARGLRSDPPRCRRWLAHVRRGIDVADVGEQLVLGSYRAVKRPAYSTEVVRTDGGNAHHNSRWSDPVSRWDVTIPDCKRSAPQYLAVVALFDAVLGSGLTFTFHDP